MIEWYKDKDIKIIFNRTPSVGMRYPTPNMTKFDRKAIVKYPFINKEHLMVELYDLKKNKYYEFTIPKDYCWDGASIPRIFWRLIGPKTDPKFLVPSLIHDVLCENHHLIDNDRNFSSRVFRGLLLAAGVGKVKAQTMYLTVDTFQRFCKWGGE